MPYWYGDERCILEITTGTAIWYHSGLSPAPVRWVLVRDPTGVRDPQAFLCTGLDAAADRDSRMVRPSLVDRNDVFRKAARILASRRNGNGPISPSHGRRRRCLGCFRSLRFGRPIPKSPAAFARDRPRGITNANLPSATPWPPFEGSSGARRIYQCPGTARMAWKFQPPSWKDSRKRSATRHKIRKVELTIAKV